MTVSGGRPASVQRFKFDVFAPAGAYDPNRIANPLGFLVAESVLVDERHAHSRGQDGEMARLPGESVILRFRDLFEATHAITMKREVDGYAAL